MLRSDGSPERDFLYVEDAVDAYVAIWELLGRRRSRRGVQRGWRAPYRVGDVVELICRLAGTDVAPDIRGAGTPPGEIDRQWVDSRKLRELTGWWPEVELEEGLQAHDRLVSSPSGDLANRSPELDSETHVRTFQMGRDQAQEGDRRRPARPALHEARARDHRRGARGRGDPDGNPALALAIQKARDASMPKDNIERAIAKGTGEGVDAEQIETVLYEGYGPGGVALLIEALTDNRNRTGADVRHLLTKNGGNLGEPGSVSYLFDKQGVIVVDAARYDEDDLIVGDRRRGAGHRRRRRRARGAHRARRPGGGARGAAGRRGRRSRAPMSPSGRRCGSRSRRPTRPSC